MKEAQEPEWVAEVGRLLPRAMRGLFAPPAEESPLWNLPLPQLRALRILSHQDDRTMREVAGSLGVAMSTATQIADRLERLGLVERRADPSDRRVVRLSLTGAGRAAMAEHAGRRDERITIAMTRLTPAEQEVVLTGLRLLDAAARDATPDAHPGGHGAHDPQRRERGTGLWEMMTAAMPPESREGS
jgi:DNA-binding MarR family transcriptional regulator